MKKLCFVLVALLSFSLFALDLPTGASAGLWTIGTVDFSKGTITEIVPVKDDVCKIVIDGRIVEYVRLNDVLKHEYSYYKVVGFDYNVVSLEKTERP